MFAEWEKEKDELSKAEGRPVSPGIAFPFALVKDAYGDLKIMAVGIEHMFVLLFKLAPSEEDAERVRHSYLRRYSVPSHAKSIFRNYIDRHHDVDWQVYGFELKDVKRESVIYFEGLANDYKTIARVRGGDPLLGPATEKWVTKAMTVYYSQDIAEGGPALLDDILAIRRPDDYGPYSIDTVHVSKKRSGEPVPFGVFIDTAHADLQETMRSTRDKRPAVWEDHSMSTYATTVASKTERDRYIAEKAKDEGGRLVHSTQLAEAPQPVEGVDRWYIVKE
jgi:hypothetical protein